MPTTPAEALAVADSGAPQTPLPAGMTPIFNGTTLDGWIADPRHFSNFSSADITNVSDFVKQLADKANPVSAYIQGKLSDAGQTALTDLGNDPTDVKAAKALAKSISTDVIDGPVMYDDARFSAVQLSPQTQEMLKTNPAQEDDVTWVNRLLLADAYPNDIRKPAETPDPWVVRNGIICSTGAGRGVLYTTHDYTNYRIIFDIRHVAEIPVKRKHEACVLVMCTRPPEGKKGMDALGGIQFQVPNGGHWDYRKGKNNGGKGVFKTIEKTKFDKRQWARVEIVVDGSKGFARMAVAQPVGSKAVEVLDFNDPTAARTGPFALQIHNDGLFDEYANIAVEVNPGSDDLITTK